jgi:F-type H+-transporting ATPase subunit c
MKMKTILMALVGFFVMGSAYAQDNGATASHLDLPGMGAALGLGLAALGGALGQGKAVAAALEGIARNPSASDKIFTPMIIGLALIESLVIYALVIAFLKICCAVRLKFRSMCMSTPHSTLSNPLRIFTVLNDLIQLSKILRASTAETKPLGNASRLGVFYVLTPG